MLSQTTNLTADDCIEAIVQADGDMHLAAERMSKEQGCKVTREVLVAVLAQDPFAIKKLNQQLRVLTVLSAFETQKMLTLSMQTQIAELEPGDAIKGFNKLTEVIGQLTDDKTSTNLNINEHVYRQLPPDIRRAISIVQQQPQLKAVNDDNEEEIDVVDQYIKDNAA